MWIVCRWKDGSGLFITSRKSRESMLAVLQQLGQEIESTVVKQFETYEQAMKYKTEIEQVDKKIKEL